MIVISGAFRLYDLDRSGSVEKEEMLTVIDAILTMTGTDEDPEEKTNQIFEAMDKVKITLFSQISRKS